MRTVWLKTSLLSVLLLVGGGCEAVPLAMLGSALGLATSVGGAGADVYRQGKLDSAESASLNDTWNATASTARELSLRPTAYERKADGQTVLNLEDDRHAKVTVTLDPRTPTLTRVRIDVGLFGSEPTARLFLQRMRAFLAEPEESSDSSVPSSLPRRTGE